MKCLVITSWKNIFMRISRLPASPMIARAAVPRRDRQNQKARAGAISRTDVWNMVRRRAADAGIETAIGCHTFLRHGDYGLSDERRADRGRATHGRALERERREQLTGMVRLKKGSEQEL